MRTVAILESENQALKEHIRKLEQVAQAARDYEKARLAVLTCPKVEIKEKTDGYSAAINSLCRALADLDGGSDKNAS